MSQTVKLFSPINAASLLRLPQGIYSSHNVHCLPLVVLLISQGLHDNLQPGALRITILSATPTASTFRLRQSPTMSLRFNFEFKL